MVLTRILRPTFVQNASLYSYFVPVTPRRVLSISAISHGKAMPPRPKPPPDSEMEEYYIKGSGPGGQKINKTNSAVQLKHIPTGIVVKSQATRSRDQNRKLAREILAQRLDELNNGDKSRSAIVADVKKKKKASASKKSRRKYRKLEEEEKSAANVDAQESPAADADVDGDVTASDRPASGLTR